MQQSGAVPGSWPRGIGRPRAWLAHAGNAMHNATHNVLHPVESDVKAMQTYHEATKRRPITFELVLSQLRKCDFAVLSTADAVGNPHAVGINYGVSRPSSDLALYVMTRRHLKKVRNIEQNPHVSLVIPVTRRLLWFLPPPTIQLRGRAAILDPTDAEGIAVFRHFWMGRRILKAYDESQRRGETRVCFLKITPEPVIATYMVGYSVWAIHKRMEAGAARVVIPPAYRSPTPAAANLSSRTQSPT